MPTRIIREGILTSEAINQLSPQAELFYRRLMSVADDHGRYFANPAILRANCYPLQLDQYSEREVAQILAECANTKPDPLIIIYNAGKHLQITKFGQQARAKSKFPQPLESELLIKCKANDKQMYSLDVGEGVGEGVVVGDRKNDDDGGKIGSIIDQFKAIRPEFKTVREIDIENALKFGPREVWQKAVEEFGRDYAGSLTCPDRPYKIFGGYVKRLASDQSNGQPAEIINVKLVRAK